ncbi:MAG: hypothetical protein Q8J84_07615 [Flavobacteriaceae bacterium]|nr:hypothetical protein [Flavobacteriaceae bacterium]
MKKLKQKIILIILFVGFVITTAFNSKEENYISVSESKFFGSEESCGPTYSIEPGSCYRTCVTRYYVFWIEVYESIPDVVAC